MPHLCPMSWPISFLFFWFLLMLMKSITWWHQLPKFQLSVPNLTPLKFHPWPWL